MPTENDPTDEHALQKLSAEFQKVAYEKKNPQQILDSLNAALSSLFSTQISPEHKNLTLQAWRNILNDTNNQNLLDIIDKALKPENNPN